MNETTKKVLYDICVNHKDLLIVDVFNYLHRYLWVHRDLSVMVGNDLICTGHIYGFTNFIISLKRKFPNCAVVLAIDGRDESRRDADPNYKAQRDHNYSSTVKGNVDFYTQLDEIVDLCSLVEGVYKCYNEKYEADDAIGVVARTVSKICHRNSINKNVYILSNDKDMYQCVSEDDVCSIRIIKGFRGDSRVNGGAEVVGVDDVKDRFCGVLPCDLVKFRAIVGDSSDNLQGYPRFLKKKAAIIATNYDYDVDKCRLVLKENGMVDESIRKYLKIINEDMPVFSKNYEIMKLKSFPLELIPINAKDYIKNIWFIVDIAKKYELRKFLNNVIMYSPYRKEILECM